MRQIALPMILANLIDGTWWIFAFSMLEASGSLMLAQQADDLPFTKAIMEPSNGRARASTFRRHLGRRRWPF